MKDPLKKQYWWCLRHHAVEPYEGCANSERLGPFDTSEDAEQALQIVAERNRQWDDDPQWKD